MVYIKLLVLSPMVNFPNKLHENLKLLNLRPTLHILMQNALILNTCRRFRKFLAEQRIRSVGQRTYSFENQLNCCEVKNVDGDDDGDATMTMMMMMMMTTIIIIIIIIIITPK